MSEEPESPSPQIIPLLPEEQSRYFNGFAIMVAPGDVAITLSRNGVPTITLNASYTVAKTFAAALTTQIEVLEKATDHKIMKLEDVVAGAQAHEKH